MQFLAAFLVLGTIVYAERVQQFSGFNPAYGYMENIGIPEAERIRKAEEAGTRIIAEGPVPHGKYPFKAGIIADVVTDDLVLRSVCGGSLISARRVLTAAHCWFDGRHQAWRFTVVLGTNYLFSGGTRVVTSTVVLHPNYNPALFRNDVAIAHFATSVGLSGTIAPVTLPFGSELQQESFAGERAIAVGFSATSGSGSQVLNDANVNVITNSDCSLAYPFIIQSHICTIGIVGDGFCHRYSGAPLIVNRNNRHILIGVSLVGSALSCQDEVPQVSARVTSYRDFIMQNI